MPPRSPSAEDACRSQRWPRSPQPVATAQNGAVVSAGPVSAGANRFDGGFRGFPGDRAGPPPSGSGFPDGAPPTGIRPNGAQSFLPGTGITDSRAFGRIGGATTSKALTALLAKDAGNYTWVAATGSSSTAAPLALATGKPVMAIGGFTGSDPAMTLARFRRLVTEGRIHYYVGSGVGSGFAPGGGGPGGGAGLSSVTTWVAKSFTSQTVGGTTVYDLTSPTS